MAKWFDEFDEITSDVGTSVEGYEKEHLERTFKGEEATRRSMLSSAWTRTKKKASNPEQVVYDLLSIQEVVRGFLKIHGVPKDTVLNIAILGDGVRGAAMFEDMDHFTGPRILLDKTIYNNCESYEMLDAYCGAAMHEASHLNHTRSLFKRLKSGKVKGRRIMFENLLEDERIEELAREESPGFAPYLHAAKRVFFEKREFGLAVNNFESLPDMDKVMSLIFAFIRCPYLITEEMRSFVTINEINVYEAIRECLDRIPTTEREVERYAAKLEELFNRINEAYEKAARKEASGALKEAIEKVEKALGKGSSSPESSPERGSGTEPADLESGSDEASGDEGASEDEGDGGDGKDREDREDSHKGGKGATDCTEDFRARVKEHIESCKEDEFDEELRAEKKVRESAMEGSASSSLKDFTDKIKDGEEGRLDTIDKTVKDVKRGCEEISKKREGRRFSLYDLEEMMGRVDVAEDRLDKEESESLAKASEERLEIGKEETDITLGKGRKTIIVHPVVDEKTRKRYDNAYALVQGHVNRMKEVFRLRLGTRTYQERELMEGRLDKRRLAHGMTNGRIFKNVYKKTDKGIALCLLLDESGSMGSADYGTEDSRVGIALRVAVLIAEALKGIPGIELEVYSYSSCGKSEYDNYIKYLYGRKNPNIKGIGAYWAGCENYDHMAIQEAGRLFKENTENKNRLMIVLSDGAPCGSGYGGRPAIVATKNAVAKLEKEMAVLQVAITSFRSEEMFKHFIRFLDLPDLINQMRRLITKIIKKTTES